MSPQAESTVTGEGYVVGAQEWGRVDADGTVWVRTSEGERTVGQYPGATADVALAYFARKFDDLAAQVALLEQRLRAHQVSPSDAESTLGHLRAAIRDAHAVGDLDGLLARLEAIAPVARQQRAEADKARHEARARAAEAREALVAEAEQLAGADAARIPWKASGDRMRELLEAWKQQQKGSRLDRNAEDDLWKRFSHARTGFERKRRQHFGALDQQRAEARAAKQKLIEEAEALASSTDWGPTAAAYRDLLARWKAAGRTARAEDDALWARFRAAQDAFFSARQSVHERADTEFRDNLAVKEKLLAEAEALLPVTDLPAARRALREIQERWEAAGKVPRADIARIDAGLRRVEQMVRAAEQDRWTRSNPQARARAQDAVAQLEQTIAGLQRDLAAAEERGDERAVRDARAALDARQEWLVQAQQAASEFGG